MWVHTWANVAQGRKHSRKLRRTRLSLEAVPMAGLAAASATMHTQKRRLRRVEFDRVSRLGPMRPTLLGQRVRAKLYDGQIPADYIDSQDKS
ncbi:hypothetical protein GCM10010468_35660 [Actinocorallia longicatena]|uniref:Uncharacterized protein n=1 Tax=Actinocorallia longicatena TaxID=111803 RepID=A0ABP6QA24_9ACTN